jgi:hypothetical protein
MLYTSVAVTPAPVRAPTWLPLVLGLTSVLGYARNFHLVHVFHLHADTLVGKSSSWLLTVAHLLVTTISDRVSCKRRSQLKISAFSWKIDRARNVIWIQWIYYSTRYLISNMRNSSSHAYTLSCPSKEEGLALQGKIGFSFHTSLVWSNF